MVRVLSIWMIVLAGIAGAQPKPMAKPEDLGLRLPVGKTAFEVVDQQVLVADDAASETPTVAKVYLEVGSHYVLLMPDGSLRSIEKRKTTLTERPFEPVSEDTLKERLQREFPGFKTRATRHYFCVYNATDSFCESKTKILETMYPMLFSYFRRQKLKPVEPEFPLVIVMFRTKQEFQAYRKMPEGMLAYYNGVNNRVFMYQYSDVNREAPLIAAKQATSTVAHEGVHQILHNIGVQKRLSTWPLWISEGLAEYFAPTSSGLRSKWKGVGRPNELRMRELFLHLRKRPHAGDGSLIEAAVKSSDFDSIDYAVSWSMVHFLLTKHKSEFINYLRDVSRDQPLEKTPKELQRFGKHFGYGLAKLEKDMLRHIRSLPYIDPIANQPYFLVTAVAGKKKQATVTSSVALDRVKRQMLLKLPANVRRTAVFRVSRFPNQRTAATAMHLFLRN